MSEFRFNRVTGDWVIIATERARRPEDYIIRMNRRDTPPHVAACPFCVGNEHMTDTVFAVPATGQWSVRVVKNKFPALQPVGEHEVAGTFMARTMTGVGYHEVIVGHPEHNRFVFEQRTEELQTVLGALRQRYIEIGNDQRMSLVVIFQNHGAGAGASLEHPHWQILATPVMPNDVRRRTQDARQFFDENGYCLFCGMIEEELKSGVRIISRTGSFVSFVPFAAISPFHVWLMPLRHSPDFGTTTDEELADLAAHLRRLLRKIQLGLDDPDFNLVVRSILQRTSDSRSFHWYLSIIPRVSQPAGFELGSGMFINASLPERSAEFLREINAG
ncbi:MAG: galactose-1-phosphate uridylyltransferase [Acidobacteria bacterium]|nr:galactose-1-phosphate uridylyltransferase [Acidobacteriota bacterium]